MPWQWKSDTLGGLSFVQKQDQIVQARRDSLIVTGLSDGCVTIGTEFLFFATYILQGGTLCRFPCAPVPDTPTFHE
jgi:hypothetical protein